jgi:hypothetical protein
MDFKRILERKFHTSLPPLLIGFLSIGSAAAPTGIDLGWQKIPPEGVFSATLL